MFRRVTLGAAVAVLLAAGLGASSAKAQILGAGAYGLGFYNYSGNYYGGNYRLPYYALYPPVYYSYPVARTYGYSPFAYPPGTRTPEAPTTEVAPVQYINPLAPQPKSTSPDKTASVSGPRMYYNPFVKNSRIEGALAAARSDKP